MSERKRGVLAVHNHSLAFGKLESIQFQHQNVNMNKASFVDETKKNYYICGETYGYNLTRYIHSSIALESPPRNRKSLEYTIGCVPIGAD